jgi:aspartate aminotransferase-like enzyme
LNQRRYLMVTGPTEVSERVLRAFMRPAVNHLNPKFAEDMDETDDLLRKIFQTKNEIVYFPGSGRCGLEAAALSILEPGDRALVVHNGVFCRMNRDIIRCVGGVPETVDFDWRRAADPKVVEERVVKGDYKLLVVVHSETSTGVLNPIKELGEVARRNGLLYMVDAISSAGGVDIRTDDWGIDLLVTGSQKCLGCLPGMAIIAVSNRAFEAMEARKTPARSFAFDLYKWKLMWVPKERGGKVIWGFRRQPITMATHMVYALNEACKEVLEEGLEARFRRHEEVGRMMRAGIRELGLEVFCAKEEEASPTITGIIAPEGIRERELREIMLKRYNVEVAGGMEELSGKMFRIGHMANTADEAHVLVTLKALEGALKEKSYRKS